MNSFALLSLYRSLTRHRVYAALNIGGLAIGIATIIVLGLYVRFETSFEKWLPDHQEIYLIQTDSRAPDQPFSGRHHYTMGGLLDQLREDFPGIVGTRIEPVSASVMESGSASTTASSRCSRCRWSPGWGAARWSTRRTCWCRKALRSVTSAPPKRSAKASRR
jgi:putative ABC transport system permease protein